MIIWALVLGAVLGWMSSGFAEWGLLLGAGLGAFSGWLMQRAVRKEAKAVFERLWLQRSVESGPERVAAVEPAPQRPMFTDRRFPSPIEPPPKRAASASPPPASDRFVQSVAVPAPIPAEPETSREPSSVEVAIAAARAWLLGGNTIVRVGLLLLLVGLSFLARYAAQAGLFPIELRLALVVLFGIALLGVGFRTRARRPEFALALQGAGVAAIYLTVFSATRFLDLLPIGPAFVLMVMVCALASALALLQDSQSLAATAFAGGFATPLLIGHGGGNVLVPFGYYTLLNLAVLFIAARRAWRWLNLLGFVATFGAATAWGFAAYSRASYWPAQVFLVAQVLIYVAAGILYARRTPGKLGNVVDGTLLFGPALAGFGLQAGLVRHLPFATAFSALGFAGLYIGTATAIGRRREELAVLREGALAIGVAFLTLAVPLALGARWTSSTWALEGAGAFWLGARQARWMPRAFGLALQGVAALTFVASLGERARGHGLIDADFLGAFLLSLPLVLTAFLIRRPLAHSASSWAERYARAESMLGAPVFLLGFVFWCIGWSLELDGLVPTPARADAHALVNNNNLRRLLAMSTIVASAWGASAWGRRTGWRVATWPSRGTIVLLALAWLAQLVGGVHLLEWPGVLPWTGAIAIHLGLLYRQDQEAGTPHAWDAATHIAGIWLGASMLADTLYLGIDADQLWNTSWAGVVFLASAVAVLVGLAAWAGRARAHWPIRDHRVAYLWLAATPIAACVALGAMVTACLSGETAPLPYLPLLNPVDVTVALALLGLLYWRRSVLAVSPIPAGAEHLRGAPFLVAVAGLAFLWLNTVWLRVAHHLLGVAWDPEALLGNFVVETGISILWTLLALGLMVAAHRRARRGQWLAGAGLLGLTVAKLLLVDMTNIGGAARIVAFIGVGVLMLVVGYLAPLPPRGAAAQGADA